MGDVTTIQTIASVNALITRKAEEANELALEVKALNERRKALFDELEANGINRQAFKDACKLMRKEAEDRDAYFESEATIRRAFGWGEQTDLFDEVDNRDGDADDAERSMERAGHLGDLLRERDMG